MRHYNGRKYYRTLMQDTWVEKKLGVWMLSEDALFARTYGVVVSRQYAEEIQDNNETLRESERAR